MRYKNPETEKAAKDLIPLPPSSPRGLAKDFALAWAELLESGYTNPAVSFDAYMDENFMPSMIHVGNRAEFIDAATPLTYQAAVEFLSEFWVHGEAFASWITRLEAETSWEVLHLGVKTSEGVVHDAGAD